MEPHIFYKTFIYIWKRTYVRIGVPLPLDCPKIEKFPSLTFTPMGLHSPAFTPQCTTTYSKCPDYRIREYEASVCQFTYIKQVVWSHDHTDRSCDVRLGVFGRRAGVGITVLWVHDLQKQQRIATDMQLIVTVDHKSQYFLHSCSIRVERLSVQVNFSVSFENILGPHSYKFSHIGRLTIITFE